MSLGMPSTINAAPERMPSGTAVYRICHTRSGAEMVQDSLDVAPAPSSGHVGDTAGRIGYDLGMT